MEDKRERWMFVHSFMKSMIYNTITTIAYTSNKMIKGVAKSREDINNDELRDIYDCFIESYNEWLTYRDKNYRKDIEKSIKTLINIFFTIADDDWVYVELAKILRRNIGRLYVKINEDK